MVILGRTLFIGLVIISSASARGFQRASSVSPDWIRVDASGRFSFAVPPALKKTKAVGIDSYVEEYRSEAMVLAFDYGQYSNKLNNDEGNFDYRARFITIGGRNAKLVTWTFKSPTDGFKYFAAVYFARVDGSHRGFDAPRLTMDISCKTIDDQKLATRILRTVTFPARRRTPNKSLDRSHGKRLLHHL